MEPSSSHDDARPKAGIAALVNEFFERRRAGEDLSSTRFAAEHPELGAELRSHLAGLALIDRACTAPHDSVRAGEARSRAEYPKVDGYELFEEIGRGGMGVVYRALQITTKRVVALKVMLGGPFASPAARRRFEREVELAARLQDPRIVRVLESGHVAGQQYYAMDFIAGVRLDEHLALERPDVQTVIKSVFVPICEAVEYAHVQGVVHRDLKPGNVLIDDAGVPHILDFGLAKATDQPGPEETLTVSLSQPGQVLGTLFYLSPEQAAGAMDQIDERTDVYALGVMLFEALTGSLPFDPSGRPSEIMQRILEAPPRRPSSMSDRVDGELETIILKALEKEKDRRYPSASALRDDLRRYLSGDPILARRPSGLYVLRKRMRKHRWALGSVAALVVIILLGLELDSWRRQRAWAEARRTALMIRESAEKTGGQSSRLAQTLYEQFPELPEAQLVYAYAQFRSETTRFSGVLALERLLSYYPERWYCRALLGEMYEATGYPQRAEAFRERVEREVPDTAEAWYLHSFATLDQRRALHYAEEALKRNPEFVLARCRSARLRLETGDPEGALRDADELIRAGEREHYWNLFKGELYCRQGRFHEAAEQFTRLIVENPPALDARIHRAHVYRRLKDYPSAVADYEEALAAEGAETRDVWLVYQWATPLWILDRTDEALEAYREVRARLGRPSYGDARRYLILCDSGRRDEADEVLRAALLQVEDPSWLRNVFRCLAGQLVPEALIADAVARDNPEHVCEAYYYAAEVHRLAGRLERARECFAQCLATGVQYDLDTFPLTPMNEYELAGWRLETLFNGDRPTSQP